MGFDRGDRGGRGFSRGGDRGGRGRGGFGDRGRGRGRGGSSDRGGSFSRGGRGGSVERGGRGGFSDRGSRGSFSDRGSRGGFSDRGSRGSFSDRGSRGSFSDRGSSRGNFSDRGSRGARGDRGSRGGRGAGRGSVRSLSKYDNEITLKEIQDGLQLYIVYKKVPTLEETKKTLEGVHSRVSRPIKDATGDCHILLFTTLEALETAKVKLESDSNVESVDYMGSKSAKKQPEYLECRQLFLRFSETTDEEKIKELDSNIKSVETMKDGTSYLVAYSTHAKAVAAVAGLNSKIGSNNLTTVREGFGVRYLSAVASGTVKNKVILRDVPKTTTLRDVAKLFPDASTFILYDATFPASQHCHASLHFPDSNRVTEVLEMKDLKIAGKKIYPVVAHKSLMNNLPDLGKEESKEATKAAVNLLKESGPPVKKMKMTEKNDSDEEQDEEEGSEEEGSEEEDSDEEDDDEEEENGDEGEDEEEEDDDDDE